MALFKINRGNSVTLPSTMTDGWAYFCTDTGEFFIDYADSNGELHRKQINADEAKKLTGYDIKTIINDSEVEIPTSKAVLDALNLKQDVITGTEGQYVGFDVDGNVVATSIPEQIQSDLSQTDESSKDYVKGVIRQENLPEGYPYKNGVTIEWDGNTDGREYTAAMGMEFYWVSPEILTDEEIKNGKVFSNDGGVEEIAKYWDQFVSGGNVTEDATLTTSVAVVRKANAEVAGAVFSTPGVYFMRLELGGNVGFISKFSSETITPISPEFLPESAIAQEVIISDTEPTDETAEIWINTSEEWNDNIPEQVQADLNQTDETAPDYVKGTVDHTRLPEGYPYKEQSEAALVEEQTLSFDEFNGQMGSSTETSSPIVAGQTYTIVWDGTEYVCTAVLEQGLIMLGGDISGNNEPFNMIANENSLIIFTSDSSTEHTLSVYGVIETIHTMDENLLPPLLNEEWTFTLADGSTVTKKVLVAE